MIDLHTHTTASDGGCSPEELVTRAAAAGVTVLSVTDHDTVAGHAQAAAACRAAGIALVPGIEITAVADEVDVHVLGYFFDTTAPSLSDFLTAQRAQRADRIRQIVRRLATFGIVLDTESILKPALDDPSRSPGRPWIARALVAGGHAADVSDAFERWLSRDRPAFVPRPGASPAEVFQRIHDAGGIASLAHPVHLKRQEHIREFANAGLDALEVYHADHDVDATARYLALARELGLAISGGSDFHDDERHGGGGPGSVSLPGTEFDRLTARHRGRA